MHAGTGRGVFFITLSLLALATCAHVPSIIGKWQELGTTATLEFHTDGTFAAVDDMDMAVSGTYTRQRDGRTRFEITIPGSPPDIVWGKIDVQGDELIVASDDDQEVERYRRAR